jgi:hypothetical protein
LTDLFLSHVLVIVGASIVHDSDLHKLFLNERVRLPAQDQESQWYFGRPDESASVRRYPTILVASRRPELLLHRRSRLR